MKWVLLAVVALGTAAPVWAQGAESIPMDQPVASMDVARGVMVQVGSTQASLRLCFGAGESLATVRPVVEAELERVGVKGLPTPNEIMLAMFTRYPCPFSPYRPALRLAGPGDVEGAWIFPEASQKLRYPPKSSAWNEFRVSPVKCEGVGYFAAAEARVVEIRGAAAACPFARSADFAVARANPQVSSWQMNEAGRLSISRTDVQGHVEEWEVFVVEQPFDLAGVQFKVGDLVAYLRKLRNGNANIASAFRHLRRLP